MILLDTHVLLWWAGIEESRLSKPATRRIEAELDHGGLVVSAISVWEISHLLASRRISIELPLPEWIEEISAISRLQFVPIDNRIAIEANQLPGRLHRDPADRMIIATARILDLEVLTADAKILDYDQVRAVW